MKSTLLKAGITDEQAKVIEANLIELGVSSVTDIDVLSDKDIATAVATANGMSLVATKKVIKALRESSVESQTFKPDFGAMPAHLISPIEIKVTANVEADVDTMIKYISILNLKNMGIEEVARGLKSSVEQRFAALNVGATKEQLEIYRVVNKFTAIDDSLYKSLMDKINMAQGLVDCRHDIITAGNDTFIPNLVEFVNAALELGQNTSVISLEVVRRVLGVAKVGAGINLDDLTMAANQFISAVNSQLKGLNTLVIQETYELYHELYKLLDSKELQDFLGITSKEDLLRKIGVEITPKQARVYSELPKLIFALIDTVKKPELAVRENLYIYLQQCWDALRTLDIMGVLPADVRSQRPNVTVAI